MKIDMFTLVFFNLPPRHIRATARVAPTCHPSTGGEFLSLVFYTFYLLFLNLMTLESHSGQGFFRSSGTLVLCSLKIHK